MRAFLAASGEVGRALLDVDWDTTSLGGPETWPVALRNSVRILLTSRFSMWMAWGPDLTFFCNDAYRRDTLGEKYPWALGRPAPEVWSEIWADVLPRVERVMTTGESTWDESLQLFVERSGYVEESYHTFSYSPLADDDGVIVGMLCVVKEDTDQVVNERRMTTLRELGAARSGTSQSAAVEAALVPLAANPWSLPFTLVYLFDAGGTRAVCAGTTGFTGEHQAAPGEILVGDADAVWPLSALATGDSTVVELKGRFDGLPTGAWDSSPEQALVQPLVHPTHDEPYGVLVAGLNRHRPLDDGYRSFVQLVAGHLAGALTDARAYELERRRAEDLAEVDRAKTDFFTNVSHEFRTPLTLLLGPAQDALADVEDPLSPGQRARLEVVSRNGERLLRLVNSLLDFSRLEAGRVQARFEPVDLAAYTATLAGMFEVATDRGGLSLVVDCPPLPAPVHVDREHWAKIVLNLVSNALKFTFDGQITVSLRAEDGEAVLRVADTGVGVPAAELPQLFERFHRVQGARSRSHEGSGIGLALVSELVGLHGGTVAAESEVGRGTTFTVRLPGGTAHLPPDQTLHGSTTPGPTAEVAGLERGLVAEAVGWVEERTSPQVAAPVEGGRPRVLVVDDNPDMRDYVCGLLAEQYDVAAAADGLEGLAQVAAVRPDLVLTDVMMPNLDGFGMLERLRADPATFEVPVVMLSARAGEDGTIEGLEAGADDYLVKPFSARELLARVKVNLELDRVRRMRSTLEHASFLLDQAQRLAGVGSWELDVDREVVTASAELQRLVGRSQAELDDLGYDGVLAHVVHPEDLARVAAAFEGLVVGQQVAVETRIRRPGGEVRTVGVRGEVGPDTTGDGPGAPRVGPGRHRAARGRAGRGGRGRAGADRGA